MLQNIIDELLPEEEVVAVIEALGKDASPEDIEDALDEMRYWKLNALKYKMIRDRTASLKRTKDGMFDVIGHDYNHTEKMCSNTDE